MLENTLMLAKIRSAARGFSFPTWTIPIALLLLTILSYGLRASSLGFFWDDWPYLWFFHRFGPQGIVSAFAGDRPFLSFIYTLSLTVLGNSSQNWQVFGLAARWLCGVGLWWALAQAWPRHFNKAAWAAMLFTVYPGFTQQWISLIYGQAFLLFAGLFFSIGLTLWLARRRGRLAAGWLAAGTLLALALSGFTMFSTEYFFGLELLRPMLLWLVLAPPALQAARSNRRALPWTLPDLLRRARITMLWWAPYLALMIAFIFWRAVLHPIGSYQLSTLESAESSPLRTLWSLALNMLEDMIVSSLGAWGQPLQILPGFLEANIGLGMRLLLVIAASGLLAWLYLSRLRSQEPAAAVESTDHWGIQAMIIGLLALLASGWPTWITGLPMRMGFPLDRYSLAMSAGVCIALAGLVDWLVKDIPRKAIVLGLTLALAAGFHFHTALSYDQDWSNARSFFWQLTWRAPQVERNTIFATMKMPFRYYEDDSLTAPLNWTYDPNGEGEQMGYILYDLQVRSRSLPSLRPGLPAKHNFRATTFSGSTSQILLFAYSPPGCVQVLDPRYDAELYDLPPRMVRNITASNPRALIVETETPAAPPVEIFGGEPRHRWCYYYEKASLARQQEDWDTIRDLARDAREAGFRPEDPVEYLPFIEGYARLRMTDDALEMTMEAEKESPAIRPALCAVWRRAYQAAPDLNAKYRDQLNQSWNCAIP